MKHWRSAVLGVGVAFLGASCASILGIQEPHQIGEGGNTTSSTSGGHGGGGVTSSGSSQGGTAATSSGGAGAVGGGASNSSGGGGASCGVLDFCPNSDPQCVDTSSDRLNCGHCGNPCDVKLACVLGHCVTPHAKTADYAKPLAGPNADIIASSISVSPNGAAIVVGGTLVGMDPFGDGTMVTKRDPFVWQTQGAGPTDGKHESICHLKMSCGAATMDQTTGDVAIGNARNTQLVGDFGLASFDPNLNLLNLDGTHRGLGLGLSTSAGSQLALAGAASVALFGLSSGQPSGMTPLWPLMFSPPSTVPVRLARDGSGVVVAGGLDGPGMVRLGDGMATVVGARDVFLGSFEEDVSVQFFTTLASAPGASASVTALMTDGADIYIAGQYQTSIDTGPDPLPGLHCGVLHAAQVGATANFVAKFGYDGKCVWARSFGSADPTQDVVSGVLEFNGGDVVVVGATTAASANFGGQDLAVPSPLFLLMLNVGDGSYEYSWAFGNDPAMQASGQPVGVATADQGHDLWIGGYYAGGPIPDLGLPAVDATHHASYVVHFASNQFP